MNYFSKNKEITAVSEKTPLPVTMVGSSDAAIVDLLTQLLSAVATMTAAIQDLKATLITESNETQTAIEDLKTDTNIINGVVNQNILAGQTANVNIDFIGLVATENYNVEVKHNLGSSVTMIGQIVENDKVNVQITAQTLTIAPINFDVHVKQNLI